MPPQHMHSKTRPVRLRKPRAPISRADSRPEELEVSETAIGDPSTCDVGQFSLEQAFDLG